MPQREIPSDAINIVEVDGGVMYSLPNYPLSDSEKETLEAVVQETERRVHERCRYIDAKYKASLGSVAITPEELYLADRAD